MSGVKGLVDQLEARVQQTENAFNEINPTSLSRMWGALRFVSTSSRFLSCFVILTRLTLFIFVQQKKQEHHVTMPEWQPVQTIDISELQELKVSLISIFFEGVPLGDAPKTSGPDPTEKV